ncbi:MAG: GldG family protein [Clostridia bacterium]|nr:GldG family protein [Clostridia bacterium]
MKKINFRKIKFGANNSIVVVIAVVLAVLLVMAASAAETKFPALKIDVTDDSITKITDQTKTVLRALDETDTKIKLIALEGTGDLNSDVRDVLNQYDVLSDNITFETENYVKNALILQTYSISSDYADSTVIVTNEDDSKFRVIYSAQMWQQDSENSSSFLLETYVTNAIGYLMSDRIISVAMTTGHNESVTDTFIDELTAENISVTQVDLSTSGISEGCDLLMIIAPYSDFTQSEIDALDTYMSEGGNCLISLWATSEGVLPRLEAFMQEWGITYNHDIVLEQDMQYVINSTIFYAQTTDSEISRSISGSILAYMPGSLTLSEDDDEEGLYLTELLTTTSSGISIPLSEAQNLDASSEFDSDAYIIAAMAEHAVDNNLENLSHLVVTTTPYVFGADGETLQESRYGNKDFLLNMINYVTDNDAISVSVKKTRTTTTITLPQSQRSILSIALCVVFPLVIIIIGIAVWLKRRHL